MSSDRWLRELLPTNRWEDGRTRRRTSGYPYELKKVAKETWDQAQIVENADGLFIQGRSVMESWQEKYMGEFAKVVTHRGGRILELGFGMGLSASAIQKYDIEEHVIIEPNLEVFRRLQEFAKRAPHKVTPVFGMWQKVIRE